MAYPGAPQVLPEELDSDQASLAVLATLVDEACSYADPFDLLDQENQNFLGTPQTSPDKADYILAGAEFPPNLRIRESSIYRPEACPTVILRLDPTSSTDRVWVLRGPGIEDSERLTGNVGLSAWLEWRAGTIAYPLGVDLILCRGREVTGLPRTTVIRGLQEGE